VLEPLGDGGLASVFDINDGGTVVGVASGGGTQAAVRWEPGASEPTELATPAGRSSAYPVAINDSGVIAGVVDLWAAVVWEPPDYAPRLLAERGPARVTDIDEDGTVVGYSARRSEPAIGVRWSPAGELTELGDFTPVAIDDGTMVGAFSVRGSGWLWPAGADAAEHLGDVPGRRTQVTDIAGGHIVGYLEGDDDTHAARFTPDP
jgi:hypothetical protein